MHSLCPTLVLLQLFYTIASDFPTKNHLSEKGAMTAVLAVEQV